MQAYREQRLKTKREQKATERQTYKANKQAKQLSKQQAAKFPTPTRTRPRPAPMQRDAKKHIEALREQNRALEKKIVALKALLGKPFSEQLAAAI